MRKTINTLLILFFLLIESNVFCQPAGPGDGLTVGDPGGDTPINDYIIPMLLVALVFGYRVLIVKKKVQTPTSF